MGIVPKNFTKNRDQFLNSLDLYRRSLLTETKLSDYLEQRGSHILVETIEQKLFEIIKAKK